MTAADRRWLLASVALAFALAAAVAALVAWQSGRQEQLVQWARQVIQREVLHHAEALAASQLARRLPGRAWQAGLLVRLPTDVVLSEAHQSALPVGMVVKRATVATQAANQVSSSVVSADLTVELAGSYSALKIWLRELLARHPSLAVLTLNLRRATGDEGVEATVVLRLFGAAR